MSDAGMIEFARTVPLDVLLSLQLEEVGLRILGFLQERHRRHERMWNIHNLLNDLPERGRIGINLYPENRLSDVYEVLTEGWAWLEGQALLVPESSSNATFRVLSRRAKKIDSVKDLESYKFAGMLSREMLHPAIAQETWLSFMRGAYPTAVFESMRAVEIAVREAAGFLPAEHGVAMIRRAFNKDHGPLTDTQAVEAEREALCALFVGAIGSYKNPHSHRRVPLDSPREAAEIVMLASHLLYIVDARKPAADGSSPD